MSGRRPERSREQASVGAVTVRGRGTRSEAGQLIGAVSDGLAAAAGRLSAKTERKIAIEELRLRLPPNAKAAEITAAVERVIARAIEERGS
jgi:hypothetical protein